MKRTYLSMILLAVALMIGCTGCCQKLPDGKTNFVSVYFDGMRTPNYSVMVVDGTTKEAKLVNLGTDCRVVMDVSPGEPMYFETKDGKHTIHVRSENDITPGRVPGDEDNPSRKIQKMK